MRPPMQAAALQQQQHEHIHQHQQQQLLQQQTLVTAATTTSFTSPQQRKAKYSHKEILVENQLNFSCSSVPAPATIRVTDQAAAFAYAVPRNTKINQQPQQQQKIKQPRFKYEHVEDSIQLVDLSSSPAHTSPTPAAYHEVTRRIPATTKIRSNSLISECPYSRSSSSEDSSYAGDRLYFQTRSQIFDDPAEHFIINFPAADSPTHNRPDLPLSETEPLLTNIEAIVADTQHSICLSKNSASLIFTRKDLKQPGDQQQKRLSNGNNNIVSTHSKRNSVSNIGAAALQTPATAHRRQHRSFKSAERSRKQRQQEQQTAYAQQQHRHSLQLNYNNNLISSNNSNSSNNNFCYTSATGGRKTNLNRVGNSTTAAAAATGITAAATRKQHAYSWYAPVYSALEEELEQDSRDSSPVHNLANTKKHHTHHYQHRSVQNSTAVDNETDALLEARNQINIQAQLHLQSHNISRGVGNTQAVRRAQSSTQAPNSLPLQNTANNYASTVSELANGVAVTSGSYDAGEGPQAGSLGLAGGPIPRLKRWENFIKNFFIRPSNGRHGGDAILTAAAAATASSGNATPNLLISASPEIRITRTPSEQNLVVMRDPAGRCARQYESEKLTNGVIQGSTSSLNVVQQKLWNIMRREGSAASLYQEKSNSIVQYRGMRKCKTVLALTRQSGSVCSPVLGVGPGIIGGAATQHMGSGIFSASGIEQIRPLNRLRNSVSTMNATCSRCSSLLSLAASGSRYSLNTAANGLTGGYVNSTQSALSMSAQSNAQPRCQQTQQQQTNPSYVSSSKISCSNRSRSRSRSDVTDNRPGPGVTVPERCSRKSSAASSSNSPPSNVTMATLTPSTSTSTTTTPTKTNAGCSNNNDVVMLRGFPPPAAIKTAIAKQPITVTSLLSMSSCSASSSSDEEEEVGDGVYVAGVKLIIPSTTSPRPSTSSSLSSLSSCSASLESKRKQQQTQSPRSSQATQPTLTAATASTSDAVEPFEVFTCKMCLVDVEAAAEATTLVQCGCLFCTECMKAYVEFEISEGAYEISCPDPQCPAQSIVTLPEIASLTTTNLMKKHHRYRLNREIELDKSRTWCPRAGCETVCLVGPGSHADAAPSTSTSHSAALSLTSPSTVKEGEANSQLLCAVQCPSCKDEFCSACKKTWHPNTTCEENSRRLVADGIDDIGIPFDNDLIKCCPMCAVPIEKDEGCAQMMCKRCKHVFCWYCLASLDDDFLLRHYDKGPCKNKLGHSRASVVWHRAQVIGIFAGFGILLLVASPLLLLAAPCIICCKCRICSGSKVDEGDGELEEATALQS